MKLFLPSLQFWSVFMKKFIFLLLALPAFGLAQKPSLADTLRGSITPERAWWDARHYDLHVSFNYEKKSISGWNTITYEVLKSTDQAMQIDLMSPLVIDSAVLEGQKLSWEKSGNAWFIQTGAFPKAGALKKISIYYHGKPTIARRAPWDGGLIWAQDEKGRPWISVACQGVGPSIWFPNKDHQYDEPDSAALHITAPSELVAVANGRLRYQRDNGNGTTTTGWAVVNPINNYNIIPYIGHYTHFSSVFSGENGNLSMDFWALDYNEDKAKAHFLRETPKMLRCFEHWFGPYPFYEDGYKLVESPHLGMEHQSAVAYGNGYENGYRGSDLSGTGVGMKWDFILVHESGHEWFGNNITSKDIADMWVHEGFTNYSETLFTGCEFGEEAADAYNIGCRKLIANDRPIIGKYGLNREGSSDMYYKGGAMLHTIRQVINDDEKFRQILRGLNKKFHLQTVTTRQIEDYISQESGRDFSKVFDQYLRTTQIPVLEIKAAEPKKKNSRTMSLSYRWTNCVKGFDLPIRVKAGEGEWRWLEPSDQWKKIKMPLKNLGELTVDKRFYATVKK